MTLYSRISSRTSQVAGLVRFVAYIETTPDWRIEKASQTFPVSSKDEADKIADALGAQTFWRNGYYMAGREGIEIHFAPLITIEESMPAASHPRASAEDAGTDGGTR
jgi:hypothetical protein